MAYDMVRRYKKGKEKKKDEREKNGEKDDSRRDNTWTAVSPLTQQYVKGANTVIAVRRAAALYRGNDGL